MWDIDELRTMINIEYIAAIVRDARSISIYIAIVRGKAGPGLVRTVGLDSTYQ